MAIKNIGEIVRFFLGREGGGGGGYRIGDFSLDDDYCLAADFKWLMRFARFVPRI